jgi:hypothetical protein
MLADITLLLNKICDILILLYRVRRVRCKPTVLREVLCEVMGLLDRTCHNFVTISGAGALRVVYAPEIQINPTLVDEGFRSEIRTSQENPNKPTCATP